MKQPIKVTPGSDEHLTLMMAPWSLNMLTGKDRADMLAWGRLVWSSAQNEQTALKSIIAAWECLPGNQRYSASAISDWLAGPMAEAINLARSQIGVDVNTVGVQN